MSSRASATSAVSKRQPKKKVVVSRPDGQIIRQYLESVGLLQTSRERMRIQQALNQRLCEIGAEMVNASYIERVELLQEQRELERDLAKLQSKETLLYLEEKFIELSQAFSRTHLISYQMWEKFGVRPDVLDRAGIPKVMYV